MESIILILKTKIMDTQLKTTDKAITRLHFWNTTESYYVVTDCVPKAKKIMLAHTPDLEAMKAINQCNQILKEDIEMYFS